MEMGPKKKKERKPQKERKKGNLQHQTGKKPEEGTLKREGKNPGLFLVCALFTETLFQVPLVGQE